MSRLLTQPSTVPSVALDDVQHFVFENATWEFYSRLLRDPNNRSIRMTYDQGRLEIVAPLPEHELAKEFIGRLIEALSFELGRPAVAYGSTTFRRREKARGVEPDKCYYFRDEAKMRSRKRLDLRKDPPPELVLEIDITHPSLPRLPIYAALGVPEVWRYDGHKLECLLLTDDSYRNATHSLVFPFLEPAHLRQFIDQRFEKSDISILRLFVAWIRKNGWSAE